MALITRVVRLFRADFHAVLDRIEPPDIILRQAIREMQKQVDQGDHQLKRTRLQTEELRSRESGIECNLEEIEADVEACFASGNCDMLRTLVRRKLEAEKLRQIFLDRLTDLERTESGLVARLEEQNAQLQSIRQKAEILSPEASPDIAEPFQGQAGISVSDEDVDVALFREQQKRRES